MNGTAGGLIGLVMLQTDESYTYFESGRLWAMALGLLDTLHRDRSLHLEMNTGLPRGCLETPEHIAAIAR